MDAAATPATDSRRFVVAADLRFATDGSRTMSPWNHGASAGWTLYAFDTLAAAEDFASRTTIYGRRVGNRIGRESL